MAPRQSQQISLPRCSGDGAVRRFWRLAVAPPNFVGLGSFVVKEILGLMRLSVADGNQPSFGKKVYKSQACAMRIGVAFNPPRRNQFE